MPNKAKIYKIAYKIGTPEWVLEIPTVGFVRAVSFEGIMFHWKTFLLFKSVWPR